MRPSRLPGAWLSLPWVAEYYLAINSRGQVPALRFEDGDVLTEAAAILAWLAFFWSP
ncbi:glutathione S-transferase N-terminal domain-containing protein [Nitrobacter winogradskyi]|uniref:glutathione S-transferase N-terminal domain-containing protein n=1 Tax=Nitrobacter winogradskyi TaxID=913 RepID=UPI0035D43A2A